MTRDADGVSDGPGAVRVVTIGVADDAIRTLQRDNRFVVTATDSAHALADFGDADCIVIGHRPPATDAFETLERARASHLNPPIVVAAGDGSESAAVAAFRAGATDYVPADDIETLSERVAAATSHARNAHEHVLHELHRTANRLTVAESREEIASIALDAATGILDYPFTGIWCYDESTDELVPLATSEGSKDLFDEPPRFGRDEGIAWQVYETQTARVIEDVHADPDRLNPDTPIRSEIIVPLGERGVMMTGTTESKPFTTTEIELFSVLTAAVEAALVRADREAELEEQNDRLDAFTRVVSHDLRSPLSVILGNTELVRDTGNLDRLDAIEHAGRRMNTRIDELLALARTGTREAERATVSLADTAREAWNVTDTETATLDIRTTRTLEVVPDRLAQLLENLFRNTVEHGSTGSRSQAHENSVEHGSTDARSNGGTGGAADDETTGLTVTIGDLDDGFYVADDGVGIPEEMCETVFSDGVTGGGGTGLGLAIVATIATEHGWSVSLGDGPGARFEFQTVE